MVLVTDNSLRPNPISHIYPPYHTGPYLEEYFFQRWNQENIKTDRTYIDIFWTNLFCNAAFAGSKYENVQERLDSYVDKNGKYFTVSQFDDGPLEKFPNDTIIFSAGGNREGENIIPIPLICNKIPDSYIIPKEKTLLASFIGSRTHYIRNDMCKVIRNKEGYLINSSQWNPFVPLENFQYFIDVTSSSRFGLAPRGYGKQSFRFYEIMQLGVVPVYISDEHYFPWNDELDWNDFCVLIDEDNLRDLDEILKSISDVDYNKLLENGRKVYEEYFTLEGMFKNILKRL